MGENSAIFSKPSGGCVLQAILALENGMTFEGVGFGASGVAVGEVVFNTAMSGYQEMLTDPSYAGQLLALTTPHIGNVGVNLEDYESNQIWASALITRELPAFAGHWRSEFDLDSFLKQQGTLGIAEIDTRHLTHVLRQEGALRACLMVGETIDSQEALRRVQDVPSLEGANLAEKVTTPKVYEWTEPSWQKEKPEAFKHHVVVLDFGVKRSILRLLVDRGCRLTVVPANTSAETILSHKPDGIFLSNGPGDPAACASIIETVQTLLDTKIPTFGICLGHQLLALSQGAQTQKMKFGHHGANHPVQCLKTKTVFISSQNHGFAVSETDLPETLDITHRSLFDDSIQGIALKGQPAFGFQGHPEASPGPHELTQLFNIFQQLLDAACQKETI